MEPAIIVRPGWQLFIDNSDSKGVYLELAGKDRIIIAKNPASVGTFNFKFLLDLTEINLR